MPLGMDQRIMYYNSMIKQTIIYGSTALTSCSAENIKSVFKLQKRAARVTLSRDTIVQLTTTCHFRRKT